MSLTPDPQESHRRGDREARPAGGADDARRHPGDDPLSRSAFWGPMAITIMGGLFAATFMTSLYLPGLYALWFHKSLVERGAGE
jgi:hypothetical protein